MNCRVTDLRFKEVINVCNGHRLGYVCDVEVDVVTGRVISLVVPGPFRFFGLLGREDDYIIDWESISRIGEDIILIDIPGDQKRGKQGKRGWIT